MRKALVTMLVVGLLWSASARAENFTVTGDMGSAIRYELRERVTTGDDIHKATLSFVVPQNFSSPTYRQKILDFGLKFTPEPQEQKTETDARGNQIITATWMAPSSAIDVRMAFHARNETILKALNAGAPFPLASVEPALRDYLKPTEQVQADDSRIRELAMRLTKDVKTEFDAVQQAISWVVDHVHYVTPPARYDAIYSFESGKGNCQNFSHLSAALLRAVGVPVRIVNGVTLDQPFDVAWENGTLRFKMGQGRHSWIEVWFPDLGWVPFDPQNTELFVSNRFIRIEVGIDNNDTKNDGLMRWSQAKTAQTKPKILETISASFDRDQVVLRGERKTYGPKNFLLCPDVRAPFKQLAVQAPPPPPVIPEEKKKDLRYEVPFVFGNLEFAEGVDFAFPRTATTTGSDQFEMARTFIVETAEYVTTNVTQYAQAVVLKKPLKLRQVGLALHNFGGDGWLWLDIFQDNHGKPGTPVGTSDFLSLEQLSTKPGYRWADFDFQREDMVLMPGAYWIALGFSGSPIVNWFYTYGKPTGPADGTRYKGIFDKEWSGALNYEFNYRVVGLTVR